MITLTISHGDSEESMAVPFVTIPKSIVGPKGDKGDKGEPGENGKNGISGKDGRDGRDGVDGKDGADGKDGKDGDRGPRGPRGERGQPGLGIKSIEQISETEILITYNDNTEQIFSLPRGSDGREVELRVFSGYLQWRYAGERDWKNLISLAAFISTGGGPISLSLAQLRDVDINDLQDGQILAWDAGSQKWVNVDNSGSGSPGMVWKGPWSPDTDPVFVENDVVSWEGSSWICVVPSTSAEPGDSSGDWDLVAQKGDPGGSNPTPLPGTIIRDSSGLIVEIALTGGNTYVITRDSDDLLETIDDGTYLRTFNRDGAGMIESWTIT